MLIDWFVVAAQIVNFIIVIVVLKIFLYKPVLDKIHQRQKKISDDLQDAATKQKKAKDLLNKMEQQTHDFEQEKKTKKKQLEEKIDLLHRQLLENAKSDVAKQKKEWIDDLKREEEETYREFKKRIVDELFAIVRISIESLAHLSLEEAIIGVFLTQMKDQELPPSAQVQIHTALEIPHSVREKIEAALHLPIEYIIKPQLIAGIELYIDGKKWSWNVEDYLSNLQRSLV